MPQSAFEQLTKGQIKELKKPSLKCIENVHTEMKKIASSQEHYSSKDDLIRFPKLAERINTVVMQFLDTRKQATENFVNSLLEVELGYINVRHPDFYENALRIVKLNYSELLKYQSTDGITVASRVNSQSKNGGGNTKIDKSDICYEVSFVLCYRFIIYIVL